MEFFFFFFLVKNKKLIDDDELHDKEIALYAGLNLFYRHC